MDRLEAGRVYEYEELKDFELPTRLVNTATKSTNGANGICCAYSLHLGEQYSMSENMHIQKQLSGLKTGEKRSIFYFEVLTEDALGHNLRLCSCFVVK